MADASMVIDWFAAAKTSPRQRTEPDRAVRLANRSMEDRMNDVTGSQIEDRTTAGCCDGGSGCCGGGCCGGGGCGCCCSDDDCGCDTTGDATPQ